MARKKFDMDAASDPFEGGLTTNEVDAATYGKVDIPDSGRVVARPIAITEIWADPTQPRRSVPTSVREDWDGNPEWVTAVFTRWKAAVEEALGGALDVTTILNGTTSFPEDAQDTTVEKFKALVGIAASIRDTQLDQPIGITKTKDGYMIVFGERRWLAFHLLNIIFPDEKWGKIPARVMEHDDFALAKSQAQENMQRSDLNAIAKARQFAKLLMAARDGGDIDYNSYGDLVLPGGCDRRYYAQVANGPMHSIPRGMGPVFEQALNISTNQMRQYRNLLKLTDDDEVNDTIWQLADDHDWAEGFMREIASIPLDRLKNLLYTVTTVTVSALEGRLRAAIADVKEQLEREKRMGSTGGDDSFMPSYRTPERKPSPTVSAPGHTFKLGDEVITRTGRAGTVVGFSGKYVNVRDANGVKQHEASTLEKAPYTVRELSEDWIGKRVRTKRQGQVGHVKSISGQMLNCESDSETAFSVMPSEVEVVQEINGVYEDIAQAEALIGKRVDTQYGAGDVMAYNGDGTVRVQLLKKNKMMDTLVVTVWMRGLRVQQELPLNDSPTWPTREAVGSQERQAHETSGSYFDPKNIEVGDVLKKDDEGNWYKADPSESTFDASDKEHSEGGDDETFLVENSIKLYETLTIMRMLAELHNANDASNILGDVLHMTPGSLRELATMSREGVVAKLSEYNQTVGNLLETAMHEFEVFTNWLVEQSDEMRGDGA